MESYPTYESVRPHFEALARVAYFKIVMKNVSPIKQNLHNVYRFVVWIAVILYNLQHFVSVVQENGIFKHPGLGIFLDAQAIQKDTIFQLEPPSFDIFVQARASTDKLVDTLFILLTVLTCLAKQLAFNIRSSRVERLLDFINGPMFAAKNPHNLGVMKQNARSMQLLLKVYQASIYFCGTLWIIFPLVNRALGEDVRFTGYIPFDTENTVTFVLVLTYMTFLITFQGYGNVTQDCTIVAFYALAKVQVQMLRYDLEHLADEDFENSQRHYVKDRRSILQERLEKCVEHYRQISWYCKEVESIFGEALTFQFFVIAWVICMTVYKIVGLEVFSAEFVSMIVYLLVILAQLFIYCYYGTQFKIESDYINQSVYFCDWLSLKPAFRRELLIVMTHCLRPIVPRIARVVPMTLDTYIAVLKSSYSLFTFLDRR